VCCCHCGFDQQSPCNSLQAKRQSGAAVLAVRFFLPQRVFAKDKIFHYLLLTENIDSKKPKISFIFIVFLKISKKYLPLSFQKK